MKKLLLDGVEVVDSFLTQRTHRAAYCDFLMPVTAKNQKTALAAFRKDQDEKGNLSGLRVSGIADLSFLEEFPLLRYLEVMGQKKVNVRPLDSLSNLRGLRMETPGSGLDFACFPELEIFVGDWHVDNHNVHRSRELHQLRAWQFKPRSADLSDLAGAKRLEWLQLTQTNITTLAGLETLGDLRYLDIAYAPKLASLDALASGGAGLRSLEFSNAKQIDSYLPIAKCSRLRTLRISSCAPQQNLRWTKGLDQLDTFTFVETNVEDGDLSPLLDLPSLRFIGTMNKRSYNYKGDEINEMLEARHAGSESTNGS